MGKFIRLHNTDDNSVIVINKDLIILIDSNVEYNRVVSTIHLDGFEPFNVNESPEKIFTMIENKEENK